MSRYGLQEVLAEAVKSVLQHRPDDPHSFLAEFILAVRNPPVQLNVSKGTVSQPEKMQPEDPMSPQAKKLATLGADSRTTSN